MTQFRISEAAGLLGEPLALSAEHALGFSDLLSEVSERLDVLSAREAETASGSRMK